MLQTPLTSQLWRFLVGRPQRCCSQTCASTLRSLLATPGSHGVACLSDAPKPPAFNSALSSVLTSQLFIGDDGTAHVDSDVPQLFAQLCPKATSKMCKKAAAKVCPKEKATRCLKAAAKMCRKATAKVCSKTLVNICPRSTAIIRPKALAKICPKKHRNNAGTQSLSFRCR